MDIDGEPVTSRITTRLATSRTRWTRDRMSKHGVGGHTYLTVLAVLPTEPPVPIAAVDVVGDGGVVCHAPSVREGCRSPPRPQVTGAATTVT